MGVEQCCELCWKCSCFWNAADERLVEAFEIFKTDCETCQAVLVDEFDTEECLPCMNKAETRFHDARKTVSIFIQSIGN